jgi:hypothetical protein
MHTILDVPWHISIPHAYALKKVATKSHTQIGGN